MFSRLIAKQTLQSFLIFIAVLLVGVGKTSRSKSKCGVWSTNTAAKKIQ
jgi:hypothetical protein